MRRILSFSVVAVLLVMAPLACGSGDSKAAGDAAADTDTLTRRQKDSLLSTLPVPGAGRIGDAQRATDRANARVRQHDTIR